MDHDGDCRAVATSFVGMAERRAGLAMQLLVSMSVPGGYDEDGANEVSTAMTLYVRGAKETLDRLARGRVRWVVWS